MRITDDQRRRILVARQSVGSPISPSSVEEIVAGMLVLHATDPASVYLSVLARSRTLTLDNVTDALYARRTLVRVLAMRRTLFVVARDDVPVIHAGASLGVARMLRRRLLKQLATTPTDPPVPDPAAWLTEVEADVDAFLRAEGLATGAEISAAVPALRTALLPTTDKAWDVRRTVTSPTLAMISADGRIVRSDSRGRWTSRHHSWAPIEAWFPDGLPVIPESEARAELARRWLEAYGPALPEDLQWWTGWNKTHTRAALATLDLAEVDLDCGAGIMLADSPLPDDDTAAGGAALLPALDPTPMGWKEREWYLNGHRDPLFDRMGNIGPTVWWEGRVVGGWSVRPDGEVVHRLLDDIGTDGAQAVVDEAHRLQAHLDGVAITPTFPTPLEKELRS